jgi:hypothetical protein
LKVVRQPTLSFHSFVCALLFCGAAFGAESWLGAVQCASATETSLALNSELGELVGRAQQYFYTPSDGAFTGQRSPWFNTNNAVYIAYRPASFYPFWDLYFAAPNNQPLTVGSYENATRVPFQTPGTPGLSISGPLGCNILTGRFTVREIAYGAGNTIDSFWATFEQHCEGAEPALFGEIRFNAHVVVMISAPARKSVEQGNAISFNVAAKEVNGNIVALTASNVPPGAIFTDNHDNTGTFVWTPGFDQSGPFSITFQADNGLGVADSATTDISVGSLIHVPAEVGTIQGAITAAWSGSRILVAPGFYQENVNFLDKDIQLISEAGPDVTIIDGNQTAPVVTIAKKQTRDALLSGFTIQNGKYAGILVRRASPVVSGNVVARNAPDFGCVLIGIGVEEGDPIIQGNTVKDNYILCYDGNGGGIGAGGMSSAQILDNVVYGNGRGIGAGGRPGHPTIVRGNIIYDNHSTSGSYSCDGGGGGILGADNSIIVQNLIFENSGTCGGGIWARGNAVIVNNTVAENYAGTGSQIYLDFFSGRVVNNIIVAEGTAAAVYCKYPTTPSTFRFNDFFNPSGVLFAGDCAVDITTNISADPQFVDVANGDFRLNPGSALIDRGDNTIAEIPEADLAGSERIVDGNGNGQAVVDMGAYEFAPNPGEFHFESPIFNTLENSGTALISVVRKAGNTGPVAVDFYTADGTAQAGADYIGSGGTLTFADGETRKTFSVSILDDSVVEGKETVNLHLRNPSGGAVLGLQSSAVLAINEVAALLTVDANAGVALNITVSPSDNNSLGNGATRFTRLYNKNTSVTLVAPSAAGVKKFSAWTSCDSVSGTTCVVSMSKDKSVMATYVTPSPISILSPNNGESWRIGSKQTIRWSAAVSGSVKVLISRNGGITWTTVSKKTANDGGLIWKVTKPTAVQAIIRVCSLINSSVCADSSPFVIQ